MSSGGSHAGFSRSAPSCPAAIGVSSLGGEAREIVRRRPCRAIAVEQAERRREALGEHDRPRPRAGLDPQGAQRRVVAVPDHDAEEPVGCAHGHIELDDSLATEDPAALQHTEDAFAVRTADHHRPVEPRRRRADPNEIYGAARVADVQANVGRTLTLLDRDVRLDGSGQGRTRRVVDPGGHRKRNADASKLQEAVIGRREHERRAGGGRGSSKVEDLRRREPREPPPVVAAEHGHTAHEIPLVGHHEVGAVPDRPRGSEIEEAHECPALHARVQQLDLLRGARCGIRQPPPGNLAPGRVHDPQIGELGLGMREERAVGDEGREPTAVRLERAIPPEVRLVDGGGRSERRGEDDQDQFHGASSTIRARIRW